jgi:hypothetical protein
VHHKAISMGDACGLEPGQEQNSTL